MLSSKFYAVFKDFIEMLLRQITKILKLRRYCGSGIIRGVFSCVIDYRFHRIAFYQ